MSYKNLEVWKLAREITIDIHNMTIKELPAFEMYEQGSQIRRSSKSIRSNIVEGYGRRNYQQDYFKHLTYSIASNDETADHLDILYETGSLTNESLYNNLKARLDVLGRKLNLFLQAFPKNKKTSQ